MVRFIDQHRDPYGVEPICAVLPIAPSTYFRQKALEQDPTKRSARAHDDACGMSTSRSTGRGRSGGSCAAKGTESRAVPSSA